VQIEAGDSVFHRPSGETWLVAYVQGDRLAWCGWPEGEANVADCQLVRKASDVERRDLLTQIAESGSNDARARYARLVLATSPSTVSGEPR
jgi:hypothetical protein